MWTVLCNISTLLWQFRWSFFHIICILTLANFDISVFENISICTAANVIPIDVALIVIVEQHAADPWTV